MIHHLVLFKLKPEVGEPHVEWMMRETRIQLLKIPGVLSVRCGKHATAESADWPFFLVVECESLEKLRHYREDPIHLKYVEEVIKPHVSDRLALDHEMEPGRDVRYS
jgi:hypothetical protein